MDRSLTAARHRLRNVALPTEHGGWMFLFEPVLLALGTAPTIPGALLAVAALGAFLTRHPLKLVVDDLHKGRQLPRTLWAERFVFIYGAAAALGLLGAIALAQHPFWTPLLIAAPMAALQLYYDASKHSRLLVAEVCGALSLCSVAAAMALVAGWSLTQAFMLWIVLGLRSVTAILYVRARLRLEHRKEVNPVGVWGAHGLALGLIGLLAYAHLLPWLACAAFIIMGARSIWGLSHYRRPVRAQIVGMQEVIMGCITVIVITVGFWLGV